MRMSTVSRKILQAPQAMSAAMKREIKGSAGYQPVNRMITPLTPRN
jgi:hypothetical protein